MEFRAGFPNMTKLQIGANKLADLCQTLKIAGKAEDWDEIDKAAPHLPSAIQRVVEYIDNL